MLRVRLAISLCLVCLVAVSLSACGGSGGSNPSGNNLASSSVARSPQAVRSALVLWFTAIRDENVSAACALTQGVYGGNAALSPCPKYYESQYFIPAVENSFDGGGNSVATLVIVAARAPLSDVAINGDQATVTLLDGSMREAIADNIELLYAGGSWRVLEYGVSGNYHIGV